MSTAALTDPNDEDAKAVADAANDVAAAAEALTNASKEGNAKTKDTAYTEVTRKANTADSEAKKIKPKAVPNAAETKATKSLADAGIVASNSVSVAFNTVTDAAKDVTNTVKVTAAKTSADAAVVAATAPLTLVRAQRIGLIRLQQKQRRLRLRG
eukprot:Tbor_TRINITY_DN5492_c2_g2::TRINITY_DN5492_c2_g2_i1::g.25468::m.25468